MADTRILLVRHGETLYNREDRMRGTLDIALTERGLAQARQTAERLAGCRAAAIFSSPLQRAWRTALAIARYQAVSPNKDPAFNDIDFGRWQGLTREEIRRRYGQEYAVYENHPEEFFSSKGDNLWRLQRTAFSRLRQLAEQHIGHTMIIVSHYVTIRVLLLACLGLTPRAYWKFIQGTCAINEVRFNGNDFIIQRVNDTHHIDG